MSTIKKSEVIAEFQRLGARVSDYDSTVYVDGDCDHCGSRFSYGHLEVVGDDEVDEVDFVHLQEEVKERTGQED